MPKKVKLHRKKSALSLYETADGRWSVWREQDDIEMGRPKWFVNDAQLDETESSDGFETKREAVAYLATVIDRPDWNNPPAGSSKVQDQD